MTLDIFFERYLLTLHGIVVAIGLIIYVGVARALPQRRDPSAAIAWVVALALLPYLAVPLYLMFGSRKLRMRDAPTLALPPVSAAADEAEAASLWARRLGRSMGLAPAATYEALQIHGDGAAALRAVLAIIAGAERSLDVCTFILARDRVGDEIAAALAAKAAQGVRVRLLIDGIGAGSAASSTSPGCAVPASRWSSSCRRSARSRAAAPTCAITARWSSPTRRSSGAVDEISRPSISTPGTTSA